MSMAMSVPEEREMEARSSPQFFEERKIFAYPVEPLEICRSALLFALLAELWSVIVDRSLMFAQSVFLHYPH